MPPRRHGRHPGVDTPYCDVYDADGREILPNGLDRRVIGYFTSWRTGKNGQPSYLASDIPWDKLSHINYAFAHVGPDYKVSVNADAPGNSATDLTWPGVAGAEMDPTLPYTGHFNLLAKYKKANPGVKVLPPSAAGPRPAATSTATATASRRAASTRSPSRRPAWTSSPSRSST